MKKIQLLALSGLLTIAILTPLCGQETWEERAAARLKPLGDDDKRQISRAQPKEATAQSKKERRILVFWRSEEFLHTSIPSGNFALEEMGRISKAFSVDLADDYSVFTKKNLKQYDAILFNNTTHLKFPKKSQQQAIMDFVSRGKGIIGIHAATDNFYEWEAGVAMMGGQFCGHPRTSNGTYAFKLDDPTHSLTLFEKPSGRKVFVFFALN